jgi:hypothetical protein
MARFISALLFFFIGNITAQAQPWWEYLDRTPERIIGLLDLPEVVGYGCGMAEKQTAAQGYSAPSRDSPRLGLMSLVHDDNLGCVFVFESADGAKEPMPTLESGYEIPASPVYERRGAWFRGALKGGSVWMRHDNPEDFFPYPELLRERLSYIQQGLDGFPHIRPTAPRRCGSHREGASGNVGRVNPR